MRPICFIVILMAMGTTSSWCLGADVGWGLPPELLLAFDEATDRADFYDGKQFFLITVRLIFRDPAVARARAMGGWEGGGEMALR